MKIVINTKYGGFSISKEGAKFMAERGHQFAETELKSDCFFGYNYRRDHPLLIEAVEMLGTAANGPCAKLKVIEIPDGIEWEICEYDGMEHIAEKHRTWS